MQDRVKLPLQFSPDKLREDLCRLEQSAWIDHFVKQNYEGNWSVIPLRGPAGTQHPVMMIYADPSCHDFADTPLLEACPYIREVLSAFDCPLDAVRLMKLTPGSVIKEHRDHDLSLEEGAARLHIPVQTNPGVAFVLNGLPVAMAPGECWYLRLSDPHWVANHGETDRVHLVIDCRVNDWLRTQVAGPGSPTGAAHAADANQPARENLRRFGELVLRDADLQHRLRTAPADSRAFLPLLVGLGATHGFHFSTEHVQAAIREGRAAWLRKWDTTP
ncbi:MAG: aspartyl/asparaginyl beta-hydroxylase domain-containing protein [Cytophagales bacterium]|nr:aspartyl/asparaginyl beta-hydroxylase domain-containing protein [Cytophagales bacterium]